MIDSRLISCGPKATACSNMVLTSTFRTGYPSPSEVESIKSRIGHLRDDVQQAQEIIKREEARVETLEKEIDIQLAIIAPIQSIPPEILGYIIELHASMEWWAPAFDGSVSRQFRQAVLASPRAWSYPTLEKEKSPRQITGGAAELWMERAGASPLHVRIRSYEDNLYRPIMMRCPEQIVDLKYSGSIINLRTTRLPNLRTLCLSWNYDISTNPFLDDVDGENPMPSLNTLGLWYLVRVPFALTPSFPPITTLDLCDINPGDCGGLVSHCRKTLKSLMLSDCETFLISKRTNFPVLEVLSLMRVGRVIDFISAPKLRVFHEHDATSMPSTSFPLVVEYASYENEPIVWDNRRDWTGLEVLQRRFPSLQRLSLREPEWIVAWILENLAIWPHLQLLEALVFSDAEVERFSGLLDKRNSNANVPITASWMRLGDKPKIPLRFRRVSILPSLCRMDATLTPIQDPDVDYRRWRSTSWNKIGILHS